MADTPQSFESIAQAQGWSEQSQAALLLTFITDQGPRLAARLVAAAKRVAATENGEEPAVVEAEAARLPVHAHEIIADLIDQLDAIGIPEWAGAEGLSLDAARQYLTSRADVDRGMREQEALVKAIGWDEPDFPYTDWQLEVANGDTRRGYAEWVLAQREQEQAEQAMD